MEVKRYRCSWLKYYIAKIFLKSFKVSPYYRFLADLVVVIHLAFAIFVVVGSITTIWWRWILWIHVPAVFWAVWIELSSGICPLTPLENWLRLKAGRGGYQGDFVENYILPVLYPAGLTQNMQILLGTLVIIINIAIYGYIFFQHNLKKGGFKL